MNSSIINRWRHDARAADRLTIAFLFFLPTIFFWRETLGRLTLGNMDIVFWFYPLMTEAVRQLHAGHLPLWNPNVYSGTPLFAELQLGLLDPLNWVYLFGVNARTLTISQELTCSLALLSSFFYARGLGWKRRSGVVTAVIYALSGFTIARLIYPAMTHVIALLPLVLLFIERLYRRGRWRDALGGCLIVAWQIFAAHPQPFVYSSMLTASYALFCAFLRREAETFDLRPSLPAKIHFLFQCLTIYLLGVALSLVQLIPSWELVSQSVRQHISYNNFSSNSVHPVTLLTTLFPWLHGQGKGIFHLAYWGPYWHHNETQFYFGVLALSLALAGAIRAWRVRFSVGRFWSFAAIIAVILSFGYYLVPVGTLLYHLPLLGNFRSTNRFWMIAVLAAAVLAGYAVEKLLQDNAGREARRLERITQLAAQLAATIMALVCVVIGGGVLLQTAGAENLIRRLPHLRFVPAGFLNRAGAEFFVPIILALGAMGVIIIFTRASHPSRWYPLVLAVLLLDFNLYAAFAPINTAESLASLGGDLPEEITELQQASAQQNNPFRVHLALPSGPLAFSPFAFSGHAMATGYGPLVSVRYKNMTGIDDTGFTQNRSLLNEGNQTLDLLNVRFVAVSPEYPQPSVTKNRWAEFAINWGRSAYKESRGYENRRARPRAWLVNRIEVRSESEQLKLIGGEVLNADGGLFDPAQVALLEPQETAKLPVEFREQTTGERAAKVISAAPNSAVIEAVTERPAMLILSEIFYPGWEARVDGQKTDVLRVDYLLRGVPLTAGKHTVEFVYRPRSLITGAMLSALALVVWLVMWWRSGKSERAGGFQEPALRRWRRLF